MNKIQDKINELMAMGCLQPDDPKFDFFKRQIVPAVVNEYITPTGITSHSFKCPFENFAVLVSKGNILERHLREKHYEEIPIGVFGRLKTYKCSPCNQDFKRREHLNRHLEGRRHLKNIISQGLATETQKTKWASICEAKRQDNSNEPTTSRKSSTGNCELFRLNDTIVLSSQTSESTDTSIQIFLSNDELSFYSTPSSSDDYYSQSSLISGTSSQKSSQNSYVSCKSTSSLKFQQRITSTPVGDLIDESSSDEGRRECSIEEELNQSKATSKSQTSAKRSFEIAKKQIKSEPNYEAEFASDLETDKLFCNESFIDFMNHIESKANKKMIAKNFNEDHIEVKVQPKNKIKEEGWSASSNRVSNKRKLEFGTHASEEFKEERTKELKGCEVLENLLKTKRKPSKELCRSSTPKVKKKPNYDVDEDTVSVSSISSSISSASALRKRGMPKEACIEDVSGLLSIAMDVLKNNINFIPEPEPENEEIATDKSRDIESNLKKNDNNAVVDKEIDISDILPLNNNLPQESTNLAQQTTLPEVEQNVEKECDICLLDSDQNPEVDVPLDVEEDVLQFLGLVKTF
ncbi:unnamed protein product [Brachionus calyciflorus]|uniref:C2H2-type domain-containing protein n=1 Tax=Brachionus calyciflorus TaxID=104777 RepID=A0A813UZB2_9BILA|nr:unnamed protein product [Brachionus calyciflorus]